MKESDLLQRRRNLELDALCHSSCQSDEDSMPSNSTHHETLRGSKIGALCGENVFETWAKVILSPENVGVGFFKVAACARLCHPVPSWFDQRTDERESPSRELWVWKGMTFGETAVSLYGEEEQNNSFYDAQRRRPLLPSCSAPRCSWFCLNFCP